MKNHFIFYIDAQKPVVGCQSNHVATIVVLRDALHDGRYYYRVGVAAKHQKDGLPFIKREGRRIATEKAIISEPLFSIADVLATITAKLIRAVKDPRTLYTMDSQRLQNRVEVVLTKCAQYAGEDNG